MVSRKSTNCWVGKCPMPTRTKWKTSLRPWNMKQTPCLLCLMPLHRFSSQCLVSQQTILSEQQNGRSKGHSSGVPKKPWQHEHWTFAVHTGRGFLLASGLIHNTQQFEQTSLTLLTALHAIGLLECERVPKDTCDLKAASKQSSCCQFAASLMPSQPLPPSQNA